MLSIASLANEKLSWFGLKKSSNYSVAEKKQLIDLDHPTISIGRQATLLGISRSSVYRVPTPPSEKDLRLYAALDRLYTAHPFYGQRRLSFALARDEGIEAGRDRIRSAMAVLGLETMYQKPRTSTPHPGHQIYPYLLRHLMAAYPNHVWGTDITYIPLAKGFCYLVALLDWYSRYVVAWELSATLEIPFCLDNLTIALSVGIPAIHNSDQGSHFTSPQYTDILKAKEVQISMDGRGRCMDNIFTERLWRTVKYEDVYLKGYATFADAKEGLTTYIHFYNNERPHQSLANQTPAAVYTNRSIKN